MHLFDCCLLYETCAINYLNIIGRCLPLRRADKEEDDSVVGSSVAFFFVSVLCNDEPVKKKKYINERNISHFHRTDKAILNFIT